MADPLDKVRGEFVAEVHELIEALSTSLLALDEAERAGTEDPDRLNEAFRAVHTVKGLAGLFGAARLGELAHGLEEVFDGLRLGRISLSQDLLDLLLSATDACTKSVTLADGAEPAVSELVLELARVAGRPGRSEPAAKDHGLDPGVLSVLTEHEEYRLNHCVESGLKLFRLRVMLPLDSLDRELEELKKRAKPIAEVITYLPTGSLSEPEIIELDLLLASSASLEVLQADVARGTGTVTEVDGHHASREARTTIAPPPVAPAEIETPKSRPAPSERPSELAEGPRGNAQTVRVDIRRLDHLMNIVGELAMIRTSLSRFGEQLRPETNRANTAHLHRLQRSFERRLGELQDGILEVRMVPLGQTFDRLARAVRQLGRQLNKEIRLVITGAETEIDKLLVEELSNPLLHMVRNAIDHGIEPAEARSRVGKPESGTIALNAFQKGNHVIIEIEDDGAGINIGALVRRAVSEGTVTEEAAEALGPDEALRLIFVPGLSTSTGVDVLSGRGVGMDVVKTNIAKLGGVLDVHSQEGIGTKVTVTLPVTLAIVRALMVEVAGEVFAIPLSNVSEAVPCLPEAIRVVDQRELMNLRGVSLPLCRLAPLFGLEGSLAPVEAFVVVATVGLRRLGIVVDRMIGQQDIVIKPLGETLQQVRGFSGATELEDRQVALVLDVASLVEEVLLGGVKPAPLELTHG